MKNTFKKFISLALIGQLAFLSAQKTSAHVDINTLNNSLNNIQESLSTRLDCGYNIVSHELTARKFIKSAMRLIFSAYTDINKNPGTVVKTYSTNSEIINKYIIEPLKNLNASVFYRCFDVPEEVLLLNAVYDPKNIKPIISLGINEHNDCLCLVEDSSNGTISLKSYKLD